MHEYNNLIMLKFGYIIILLGLLSVNCGEKSISIRQGDYEIGCYYFPNYHVDPYNEKEHGPEWTEWELVKHARSRFEGHIQPKVPVWGYEDEAHPKVMERKIRVAADHGIDFFIFD